MLELYSPDIDDFKFVWEKLEELINTKKIILIDKFFSEIQNIKAKSKSPPFVEKFINRNKSYKEKSDFIFFQKVQAVYEENKEMFKGNYDSIFNDSRADGFLIAYALILYNTNKELKVAILTSEKLQSQNSKDGKQRLNIPSLAKKCGVDCFDLNNSIKEFLTTTFNT